jgi:hypothetical protein
MARPVAFNSPRLGSPVVDEVSIARENRAPSVLPRRFKPAEMAV